MKRVRFARAMRSGDGVHIGSIAAGSYGRFDGAVTRDVSLKKRAALGQVVPQPLSSSALPRPPPPAPRPPPTRQQSGGKLGASTLRTTPAATAAPAPPRPAATSARSRVMNDGSSDARYASIATIVAFPLRSSNTILSKLSRLVWCVYVP